MLPTQELGHGKQQRASCVATIASSYGVLISICTRRTVSCGFLKGGRTHACIGMM